MYRSHVLCDGVVCDGVSGELSDCWTRWSRDCQDDH